MGRTKMTARKSTGCRAPRTQLSTKAARKDCVGKAPRVQLATRIPRNDDFVTESTIGLSPMESTPDKDQISEPVPTAKPSSRLEPKMTKKPVLKPKQVPATKPRTKTTQTQTVPVRKVYSLRRKVVEPVEPVVKISEESDEE